MSQGMRMRTSSTSMTTRQMMIWKRGWLPKQSQSMTQNAKGEDESGDEDEDEFDLD